MSDTEAPQTPCPDCGETHPPLKPPADGTWGPDDARTYRCGVCGAIEVGRDVLTHNDRADHIGRSGAWLAL